MKLTKSKFYLSIAAATMALSLGACSDDAKDTVHNIKEAPNLQGAFNDACATSKIANTSETTRLIFEGNNYTRAQIFYNEPNCTTEVGRVEYKGEFRAGDDKIEGEKQGGNLDLDIQTVTVKVSSPTLAKTLNFMNYCGHTDFADGKEVSISGPQTQGLCPLENVPVKLYTSYKVEGDKLYLGDTDITTMSKDETKRSSNIVYEKLYKKD
jgi:hypothetical protein